MSLILVALAPVALASTACTVVASKPPSPLAAPISGGPTDNQGYLVSSAQPSISSAKLDIDLRLLRSRPATSGESTVSAAFMIDDVSGPRVLAYPPGFVLESVGPDGVRTRLAQPFPIAPDGEKLGRVVVQGVLATLPAGSTAVVLSASVGPTKQLARQGVSLSVPLARIPEATAVAKYRPWGDEMMHGIAPAL